MPVGLLLVLAVVALVVYGSQRNREEWSELAKRRRLRFTDNWSERRVHGTIEDFGVSIWTEARSSGKSSTTYTCLSLSGIPTGLQLSQEGMFTSLAKVFAGTDVEVGDPAFDAAMHVKGDPMHAASLLDLDARRVMLANPAVQIRPDGSVYYEFRGNDPRKADEWLDWLLQVARAFRTPDGASVADRLERIARHDPHAAVRANALRLMLENLSESRAEAMARAVLADADSDVELRSIAARRLRDTAELARLLHRPAPEGVHARVLRALRELDGLESGLVARIDGMRVTSHEGLRLEAIRALGVCADVDMVQTLRPIAGRGPLAGPVARAAADAIDAIQGRVAQGAAGALSLAELQPQQGALQVAEPGTEGSLEIASAPQRDAES